jgi:hypothetical protein
METNPLCSKLEHINSSSVSERIVGEEVGLEYWGRGVATETKERCDETVTTVPSVCSDHDEMSVEGDASTNCKLRPEECLTASLSFEGVPSGGIVILPRHWADNQSTEVLLLDETTELMDETIKLLDETSVRNTKLLPLLMEPTHIISPFQTKKSLDGLDINGGPKVPTLSTASLSLNASLLLACKFTKESPSRGPLPSRRTVSLDQAQSEQLVRKTFLD